MCLMEKHINYNCLLQNLGLHHCHSLKEMETEQIVSQEDRNVAINERKKTEEEGNDNSSIQTDEEQI